MPKAESLSQGPRPVSVKTLCTLSVLAQTHLPKFLETSLGQGKREIRSKLIHDSCVTRPDKQWTIINRLKAYESRINFDCIFPFPLFRLVSRNLGRWVCARTLRVYKVFTKTGQSPRLKGDGLGPTGVINCNPLSAMSF